MMVGQAKYTQPGFQRRSFVLKHFGRAVEQHDREAYLQLAHKVVAGIQHTEEEPDKKLPGEGHRTSSQDWIMGRDHQLQVCTGQGLICFLLHSHDPTPAHQRQNVAGLLDKVVRWVLQCMVAPLSAEAAYEPLI